MITVSEQKQEKTYSPPSRTFTTEFFVGVFAVVGCLCFAYLAINIGGMRLGDGGTYLVSAEFDNVSGLEQGASVEMAGVSIGEVTSIVLSDTSAKVSFTVTDGVNLREDDILAVRTKGIIGDRYLKVIPGGSEEMISDGGEIFDTESVVEMEEVIGKVIHSLNNKDE